MFFAKQIFIFLVTQMIGRIRGWMTKASPRKNTVKIEII